MAARQSSPLLRQALLADAAICAAAGLLMLPGAGFLASLFGLPEALLRSVGLALIPYAAFVAYTATRRPIPLGAVWAVILLNALWAGASIILLLGGWLTPNTLGTGLVLFQALVVAGFAAVQYLAVRRKAVAAG
jgi:hypothetical protein